MRNKAPLLAVVGLFLGGAIAVVLSVLVTEIRTPFWKDRSPIFLSLWR